MARQTLNLADETAITEITIGTDGRVYVFGLSREVLAVLVKLCPGSESIEMRLSQLDSLDAPVSARRDCPLPPGETMSKSPGTHGCEEHN
jgi:hypothetical protein